MNVLSQSDGGMLEWLALAEARGTLEYTFQLFNFGQKLRETRYETFWRTLVMDKDILDWGNIVSPAPDELGKMYRVLFELEELPSDFEPELPIEARRFEFSSAFATNVDSNLTDRCFFTTQCGRMGIGPCHSKPDDVVVVLFGGAFCFALRPKGRHYQLVGDAYVQGVMAGECVQEYLDDPLKAEEFALC